MARITKYLLLALIVAVAFNHVAKAQEEEEPAPVEEEPAAVEEAEAALAEEPEVEPAADPEAEPAVDPEPELGEEPPAEDNVTVGSIRKVGAWLSKFGWWNIWKGVGLKKVGEWWKWDKIFKEDWWKKKWLVLGSPLEEEESKMMFVLSNPETKSMGINADDDDATYFLAPPGFENELAKRGIAINPSIVPATRKQTKKKSQKPQKRPSQQTSNFQYPQQYAPHQVYNYQNVQHPHSWLQRAFPSLDAYDREGRQGSEIDFVRMKPNTQSVSRTIVDSLRQQMPEIIPLTSSLPNTPMYAYDQNGMMQLISQEPHYKMMNEETQNPAVLQDYQQARTGFQALSRTQKLEKPKRTRIELKPEPEELLVPMTFPRSNSISTKDEIERALNSEETQKMLEQYARKNWKTMRKDAIVLKFVPKSDLEARPSVKRQATATIKQQKPTTMFQQRQMISDELQDEVNTAYARDFNQWASQYERAMQAQDQQQQFRQMTPIPMQQTFTQQKLHEEVPQPMAQQMPVMTQHGPPNSQDPRRMMIESPQQIPILPVAHQELHQSPQQEIPMMQQQPIMQQQPVIQQEPRQWVQEQPTMQQGQRQWIQEQPQHQQMTIQQEFIPQQEPRQWIQEQPWMTVDPSMAGLDEQQPQQPRQMTHQIIDQTQGIQTQQRFEDLTIRDDIKLENNEEQHPIVSEMGPQIEENARFFKKAHKSRPSSGAHYVTHNYNIYSSGSGSSGYGGGSSGYRKGTSGYGGGSSGYGGSYGGYGGGSSGYGSGSGYGSHGSSYGGSHGGQSYGSHSSGYGGGYGGGHSSSYGSGHGGYGSGYGSSYGGSHGGYGGGHGVGYRSAETAETPTATIF